MHTHREKTIRWRQESLRGDPFSGLETGMLLRGKKGGNQENKKCPSSQAREEKIPRKENLTATEVKKNKS